MFAGVANGALLVPFEVGIFVAELLVALAPTVGSNVVTLDAASCRTGLGVAGAWKRFATGGL